MTRVLEIYFGPEVGSRKRDAVDHRQCSDLLEARFRPTSGWPTIRPRLYQPTEQLLFVPSTTYNAHTHANGIQKFIESPIRAVGVFIRFGRLLCEAVRNDLVLGFPNAANSLALGYRSGLRDVLSHQVI